MDSQREQRGIRQSSNYTNAVIGPAADVAGREVPGASTRIPRGFVTAFWYVLFWTALSFFFASQIYILSRGKVSWGLALSFTMPRWFVWGLLTPAIFWVDKRMGAGRSLAARVAWHVPLGIAWTGVSLIIRLLIRPLRGSAFPDSLAEFVLERFYWDVIVYAVIAGVSVARDYAAQVRLRERETHQLAMQTAELEHRLVEARLQTLRAQLQPHFLFNALNTISAFTAINPPAARRLMEQLGDLLRASLTHASRPLVALDEELTFLDDYLAIETARFEGRLTVSVHADDDLLEMAVPGFLLQPLVENAIRHGVAPRISGGHVEVTATRDGPLLKIRVRDNGVGLPGAWRFEDNAGVGLRNVAARLEHLYGRGDLMRLVPNPSGGVEVQLDLPIQSASASTGVPPRAATAEA